MALRAWPLRDGPDLAIEVVITSGGIAEPSVYAGLGIPEVWFWIHGGLQVRVLDNGAYLARERSALLPELDLDEVAALAREPDQHAALRRYRERLRAR